MAYLSRLGLLVLAAVLGGARGFALTRRGIAALAGAQLGVLLAPAVGRADVFSGLNDEAQSRFLERGDATRAQLGADGVDNASSALIKDLLQKTEANRVMRKRMLDIEMFEKSQSGLFGPGRRNFAVVDETGSFKILNEFEFDKLQKAGRISAERQVLPES